MAQQNDSKATDSDAQPVSEAMTTQSGSDALAKDAGGDTASPYGTRSRNRNGSSRPNYAEDRDIEADVYDYYQDKKDGDPKKPSRQASAAANVNGEVPRAGANSRKTGTDDTRGAPTQANSKDQNSAASNTASPTAQPPSVSQPSRKRKAAAQSAGPNNQVASTSSSSRRTGTSTAAATATSTSTTVAATPPTGISWPDTNMLTFEDSEAHPVDGRMVADDGTVLKPNDHVYLVCEPPGEPYYLGRIMEFLHSQNDSSNPVDAIRINWYYRPKDIGRKAPDTRMVFATMHSDISPLTALRGKCQIRHKAEIANMDEYRKTPDSFWYEKLYDRYIQKNYDLIPTTTIVNVPANVKKVLDERWKYVLVEQGRGKELTSAVKLCKRCTGYCASNDSVDCAVCQHTYHMNCVKPPLLKKPSRGFAWSCAACSRAQERKLEARNTPNVTDPYGDADDDDMLDEEDEDVHCADTSRTTPSDEDSHHEGTAEQIYQASLWPYRYLGMHCKPIDALDYDDRIYPRASTRIGPRNQANVGPWPGQVVQYVKPPETKKNGKKDTKSAKETHAALEAQKLQRGKRPKWVQDMPPGYTARGDDHDEDDVNCTATRLWMPPPEDVISEKEINQYMEKAKAMAKDLDLPERSTNLQDIAAITLFDHGFNAKRALSAVREKEKSVFKEPKLTPAELKKFEEGVAKYGSELHLVMRHVKTLPHGTVTRFYYTWKKTDRGKQIWANYPGRKGKKEAKRAESAASKFADDVADNDDDSAFDNGKAAEKKRGFMCQFCSTTSSRQWRRAPNAMQGPVTETGVKASNKDKGGQYVVALCRRCAELWRRYAIRWEDMEEVAKKVAQAGGRAWKRKQDEELLKELQAAKEMGMMTPERAPSPINAPAASNTQEPPRKKLKGAPPEKEADTSHSDPGSVASSEKPKKKEKTAEPVATPELPKARVLPCAICDQMEPLGDQHVSCRECRLTVHRNCYGVLDHRNPGKWVCDMCANDKSPQVSIQYKCVLCPVEHTEHDFVEQPKLTHHKKKMSEKDRERERVEVSKARKAAEYYRKRQEEMNRPVNPREPLKRTADNNWVHVTCAVWTPEVKFGNAKALAPSEGIPSIPRSRYDETCQACNKKDGACVSCHHCRAPLHVECARQQGHVLGFDITPVKSSRRDQFNIVTINGEVGTMSAAVWCKDHVSAKMNIHRMHDVATESGLNALQLYVQNFKQADLTLTGTVRKANLMTTAAKMTGTPTQPGLRRSSTTTMPANGGWNHLRQGEAGDAASDAQQPGDKVCITCGIDVSPKWWPIDNSQERELTNGHYGALGSEAQKFVEQRKFQCHQCRKTNRTTRPHPPRPSPPVPEALPPPPREPSLPVAVPPLRSPPPPISSHREAHTPTSYAWTPHVSPHSGPPPIQAPAHVLEHTLGSRPAPVAHAYPPPPQPQPQPQHRGPYDGWGARPGSQHGSPPRHLNGGPPPPLHNQPPPITNLSSLRPPPLSSTSVPGPMPVGHQVNHGPQPYPNGLPSSPRRPSGPSVPSRYAHPYHGHTHHGPPAHMQSPGMSNGAPPPRNDVFAQGMRPQRTSFPGGPISPPGSRGGLPLAHEPPRQPESRPASGASASPSLRNLLS